MATLTRKRPPVLNLPNLLTTGRLGLAIVLFILIGIPADVPGRWWWCIGIFAFAAFTDWLDGYLARKQGLTSTLGRNLDPLVDKVLTCGLYIFLLPFKDAGLSPWIVTVIVARELIITGLRSFLEQSGAVFGADWLGKLKMGFQCAALFGIFVYLDARTEFLAVVRDILIYVMLATTALSGLQYLWKAAGLLKGEG